jgi:hypothetical protein
VVIYGKTANWSEVARLMLQARGGEGHVMEGGIEAWSASHERTARIANTSS